MKRRIKIFIDIAMLVLFLYLMSYHPGMGLMLHALLGITLFILFIVHHVLNRFWFKTLFKGKYNLRRSLLCMTNVALLLAMLLMMISSLQISGMVFDISFLPLRFYWRNIHVASTAWGFIIISLHLGLHLHGQIVKFKTKHPGRLSSISLHTLEILFLTGGAYSLINSGLWLNLRMIPESLPPLPMWRFYLEYTTMILACCIISHYLLIIITKRNGNKPIRLKKPL